MATQKLRIKPLSGQAKEAILQYIEEMDLKRDNKLPREEALAEMELDVIDIFLLHEIRQDPDWDMRAEAWQCLQDYKEKGVIRAIGVSTHHVDVTAKMAHIPECDVVFPLINFASLGIRNGDPAPAKRWRLLSRPATMRERASSP